MNFLQECIKVDSENLKAFIAVAQLHSFSLAGEQLHLTQPAVSKRIAGLEQQLGQKLFHRVNRRVELTPSGKILLGRAGQIMQAIEDTRRALVDLSGEVRGELRVASVHAL
jgi:DNA-binding transcriptional LysR family regulator